MGYICECNNITIKATMCAVHNSMSHQSLEAKQVNSELCTQHPPTSYNRRHVHNEDMYTTEDMPFDPDNFGIA